MVKERSNYRRDRLYSQSKQIGWRKNQTGVHKILAKSNNLWCQNPEIPFYGPGLICIIMAYTLWRVPPGIFGNHTVTSLYGTHQTEIIAFVRAKWGC